ncbi:MAG: PKD domain-containing protein [Bacteroidetes bacterium]|nr:PKD domain-containing protein [Bacteroidota bacterium]MBU1718514.1 PKD domain-containing protein [Bacteroidota bacterium]
MKRRSWSLIFLIALLLSGQAEGQNCTADYSYLQLTSAANPLAVEFTDLSVSADSIVAWNWSFGDGIDAIVQNPSHTYSNPGEYMVCLSVQTVDTCIDSYCDTVIVEDIPFCEASFTYFHNTCPNCTGDYFFIDVSPEDTITHWLWVFGDGTYSNLQHPTHRFDTIGNFSVCLTIQNSSGCEASKCLNMLIDSVYTPSCSAHINYEEDTAYFLPNTYRFYSYVQLSGLVTQRYWDFGDGYSTNIQNPRHTFSDTGTFQVCFTVETNDGCTATACDSIYIAPGVPPCNAFFELETDVCGDFCVSFHDLSNGSFSHSLWSFGDGDSSDIQNPEHTFSEEGHYLVCLQISDSATGCFSEYCDSVLIESSIQPCISMMRIDSSVACGNLCYSFINVSFVGSNTVTVAEWRFNDGTEAVTGDSIVHSFPFPDLYEVWLYITVLDSTGEILCSDSAALSFFAGDLSYHNLGGQIFTGLYPAKSGHASIYKFYSPSRIVEFTEMDFDTLGYFWFYQLPEARYIIHVAGVGNSKQNRYFPTYFGDELRWGQSTIFFLNANNYDADVNLIPVPANEIGNCRITGQIASGVIYPDTFHPGITEVILYDQSQSPEEFVMSTPNGHFGFGALQHALYYLWIEIPGYSGDMIPVDLTTQTNADGLFIDLSGETTTIPETKTLPSELSIDHLYPNPVSDYLNLHIISPESQFVQVKTFDLTGKEVSSFTAHLNSGENFMKLPAGSLPSGFYFLGIDGQSCRVIKKFLVVR